MNIKPRYSIGDIVLYKETNTPITLTAILVKKDGIYYGSGYNFFDEKELIKLIPETEGKNYCCHCNNGQHDLECEC